MRLDPTTLATLPPAISRPTYDRTAVHTGIVHLGIGAFHRAHQALCTDDVLAAGDLRWGILGASLRSPATRDALAPQHGLYTLNQRAKSDTYRVIGSIQRLLVAPEHPPALIDAMAHPDTRIVSLTITEKGYCLDPASGTLDETHPDILHDLAHPNHPRSAPALMVAAIARRRAAGLPPFTALSCDNLAGNGPTLHRVLTAYARRLDPGLGAYVEHELACPATMVDRIVPATTPEDRTRVAAALGLDDAWPVIAEPFLQWVIEDRFPSGRPAWDDFGATMADDVAPFEAMKLRVLNGTHSALAYMGLARGHETVAHSVADPVLATFARALMQDAAATLHLPPGIDAAAYQHALMHRFANPALRHRLAQIAMDGSQKLPPRILHPMRDRLAQGRPVTHHAAVVAAWLRHVATAPALQDPMAEDLRRAVREGGPIALLGLSAIFGEPSPAMHTAIAQALAATSGNESPLPKSQSSAHIVEPSH